eukprot:451079-Amorphochlora_amoeboformis.AAC.1
MGISDNTGISGIPEKIPVVPKHTAASHANGRRGMRVKVRGGLRLFRWNGCQVGKLNRQKYA